MTEIDAEQERRTLATRIFEDALTDAGPMMQTEVTALARRAVFAADALIAALAERSPEPKGPPTRGTIFR